MSVFTDNVTKMREKKENNKSKNIKRKTTKKKRTKNIKRKATKKKKTRKGNKKLKKTGSKIQRGGDGGDVKLAILLITTHGNLDNLEEPSTHDFNINIRKVNATIPGVCNFIENDELLEMGNEMKRFIEYIKGQWLKDDILQPSSGIELKFKSPAIAQQHIDYLSQSLRSFIPRIDGVYKETVKNASSKRIQQDPMFIDPNDPDPDVGRYTTNINKAYQLYKWDKGDQYLDKTYTIITDERVDTTSNQYNNTVLFLSEAGIPESNVINIPHNLRSNKMIDENKEIKLSEILKDLTDNGYTDTIIIDLSCSTGWDDIGARALTRSYKKGDFPHYGGK